jgi:hypothetical protein
VREEVYGDMRPLSLSSLLSRRETAWRPVTPIHVRNCAAMALAATSGATDAIGYLTLGHVFTSAMTGNLVLLGISLGHHNGERAGRVLVSLVCFMFGAAFGARIARSPKPDDPVRPPAVTAPPWRSKSPSSSRTRRAGGPWAPGRTPSRKSSCSAWVR